MSYRKITLDNVDYFYKSMQLTEIFIDMCKKDIRLGERKYFQWCPICKRQLDEPCKIVIIINNYKAFPNVFVHKECFEESSPEHIMIFLKKNYEEAKKYEHWFVR